jgi:shikimate kinase/3-dehydroquinate synthase
VSEIDGRMSMDIIMSETNRIVLVGFSGSGKSTIARLLAGRLDWRSVDTDADIERDQGMTVPEIFTRHGETRFRELERHALVQALGSDRIVVATGGGAVVDPELWSETLLRRPGTLVVALDVEPETVLTRLRAQQAVEGAAVERPMLAGDDPLGRVRALKERRQSMYDQADITLVGDNISPGDLAAEIEGLILSPDEVEPALRFSATSASSDVFIGSNSRNLVGNIVRATWPNARRAWVISDDSVGKLHGASAVATLSEADVRSELLSVPVGESSKSWAVAGQLLDRLLDGGIERGDMIVALGGGVIGDLAGFVAATVLRGVPLVQVPTSLLAMVDSSIGGKTGINHRTGKNLIGAFYQPPIVVIDPQFLHTLPLRELNAGWAEIIKHAVIQVSTPGGERGDLLAFLERNRARLQSLEDPAITYLIRRNVALKAAVVEADEREIGIRAYLNFGHTIGHAIEAADYTLLHGEAVALGIRAVLHLARQLDSVSPGMEERVNALLDGFGLPCTVETDLKIVLARMSSDKKRVAGKQRWVFPQPAGGVAIRDDIPPERVVEAIRFVTLATTT